ncbi:MAG: hypothetical protein AAF585_25795 [Verrucomicrobiota bacterium]
MKMLLTALVFAILVLPAAALISVAEVVTMEEIPDHIEITTSPASQYDLINVWVKIKDDKPETAGVWASLRTSDTNGKILSRANLASHQQEHGFSVSFQMIPEAMETSSVMISVRGGGRPDVGYSIDLSLFAPKDED